MAVALTRKSFGFIASRSTIVFDPSSFTAGIVSGTVPSLVLSNFSTSVPMLLSLMTVLAVSDTESSAGLAKSTKTSILTVSPTDEMPKRSNFSVIGNLI